MWHVCGHRTMHGYYQIVLLISLSVWMWTHPHLPTPHTHKYTPLLPSHVHPLHTHTHTSTPPSFTHPLHHTHTHTHTHNTQKAENKSVNFHDVVDEDDRSMENRFSLVYIGWLIDSALFRVAMLIAIFLNCVVIGVQTDRYLVGVVCSYMTRPLTIACFHSHTPTHTAHHAHTHYTQEENFSAVFIALDKFFLTVFTLEILIKWYHDFIGFWKVAWNLFDFVIVSFSLIGPSE